MKCFYKLFILIFCFGAVPLLQGQTPLKQVNSTVHISKIFAVPPDINLEEELNSFDLSRMIWEERSFTTKMVINQDHKLTITTLYPQQPRYDRDYEFNIGMSISDENNAILYDHSGELLHSIEHDTSLSEFSIHPDSVDFFAMVNLFDQDLIDLSAWYEQNDFTVAIINEHEFSAINDSLEIYIDKSKMIFETRFFSDSILTFSDWQKFQEFGEYTIPMVSVLTTYENLSNDIRMQISEIKRYTMYQVINEEGDTIISFYMDPPISQRRGQIEIARFNETEKKNHQLKVYPNPTTGLIHLEIPLFISDNISCEIINAQGTIVHSEPNVQAGSSISIDVSQLKQGLYFVRCGKGNKWKTTRFVKN